MLKSLLKLALIAVVVLAIAVAVNTVRQGTRQLQVAPAAPWLWTRRPPGSRWPSRSARAPCRRPTTRSSMPISSRRCTRIWRSVIRACMPR
jgi:hypothetical protein